jgi:glycerophosphoryl diester phosphodiesterase
MKRLLALIGLLSIFSFSSAAMDIVGHRGASHLAPENTLASVKLAWELGADAVEIDVHLSKDKKIIVIHDADTKRTTPDDLEVAQTDAANLTKLDAGSYKDKKYSAEKLPLVDEILATIPQGKQLLVEVKCGPEIVPILKREFERTKKTSQVFVISFNFEVVVASKTQMPAVPALWLTKSKRNPAGIYQPHEVALIDKVKKGKLDGFGVHYAGVSLEFATAVKRAGLKLYVWTVDQPDEAKRFKALEIDGLISNRPGWIREQLK